ncbi:MAG: hypothetical protein HY720_12835 [Planctomycetes bacterium]|nr:hypothetical protein [Planctomycetota bacterium]
MQANAPGRDARLLRLLGALSALCYAVHAIVLARTGHPAHLLWTCHLASLAIGAGLLADSATANAAGFLWLCVGTPLWIVGMVAGGEFLPTSVLTHGVAPVAGAVGLARLGLPRRVWWKALAGVVLLHLVCRVATPPVENVNLSSRPWEGFETTFPSHTVFLLAVLAVCGVVFFAAERLLARICPAAQVR